MKKVQLLLVVIFLGCICAVMLSAEKEQLIIYTRENMFSKSTIKAFEKVHPGIQVVLKTFDEDGDMFDELTRTGGGEYDLIIAEDYIVDFVTHSDPPLAQKLDKGRIPNISNVDPLFVHQFYDPDDEYTVPCGASIQTIVYDPSKVTMDIKGYADLWDSTLQNSVGIIDNYRIIDGMALKVLGKSYNTNEVDDIKSAGEMLITLVPNIYSIKDTGLEDDLIEGNISVAVMYTDQVVRSRVTNPDLAVVYPREGVGFGIMPAFIPVNAPNLEAAYHFLNFILEPIQGASCFEYIGYYCTFRASKPYINPALKEYLIVPDFMNFEMIENVSQEAEDEHVRIWEDFLEVVSCW